MPFNGKIHWSSGPDPERLGYHIATGIPGGMDGDYYILVQELGDNTWGWLLMDEDHHPVQMRNGYVREDLARIAVAMWLEVNPNG